MHIATAPNALARLPCDVWDAHIITAAVFLLQVYCSGYNALGVM